MPKGRLILLKYNMKKWKIVGKLKGVKNAVSKDEKRQRIDEIIKVILENRGIKTKKEIEEFLNPRLETVTAKSVGIDKKNLDKAIRRIEKAIKNNEKIIVYGDYDTDGICATAILWETLYKFYKNVLPYIPHRINEGYGLSKTGIQTCLARHESRQESEFRIKNRGLIITVDNGIMAHEAVEFAKKHNIDVIITDHHALPGKLPKACAIIHSTKLCGAGIAWLLAGEILSFLSKVSSKRDNNIDLDMLDSHFELVAFGTIADLMPLVGPNRTLVKFGLESLRKTKRMGLLELFKAAGIKKEEIGVYEIGHIIAPRLNATGRISNGIESLRLLCTKDIFKAQKYALLLDQTNRQRQSLTEDTFFQAKSYFDKTGISSKIIFVSHKEYNQGIIGLVASKLVEEFYRPSFVLSIGQKYSKGSARSVRGFNIIEFIRGSSSLLLEAGGHPMAAGFTVETERVKKLQEDLEKRSQEALSDKLLSRTQEIDLVLDFESISLDLYQKIAELSPFGIGNPEPVFTTYSVTVSDIRKVGKNGDHLKLMLKENNRQFEAIAFGMAKTTDIRIGDREDIAYVIELNQWNNNRRLQLKVKDFKKS